jgi:hypothetical protein
MDDRKKKLKNVTGLTEKVEIRIFQLSWKRQIRQVARLRTGKLKNPSFNFFVGVLSVLLDRKNLTGVTAGRVGK